MFIVTIDCGTTNSRLYLVNENGLIVSKICRKIGIGDVAISGNNKILKEL